MAFSLLFPFALTAEEPWGRDSDLASPCVTTCQPPQTALQRAASLLIGFHHCVISPADGPRSHFFPSSSCYTEQAIRKYGFVQGFLMGCDRLTRENNEAWVYPTCIKGGRSLKFDPP